MTDATPAPGTSSNGHVTALNDNMVIRDIDFSQPQLGELDSP